MASRLDAEKEGVVVPMTLEEYCIKHKAQPQTEETDITDFYDDDYDIDDDEDDQDYDNEDNDEDSGNGES